jgi:hypothetical protein
MGRGELYPNIKIKMKRTRIINLEEIQNNKYGGKTKIETP